MPRVIGGGWGFGPTSASRAIASAAHRPVQPLPPPPPMPPQLLAAPADNPAIRAPAQPEIKEGKEAAEARPAHKGTRKAYVSGQWIDKKELLESLEVLENKIRADNRRVSSLSPENLEKEIARQKFLLTHQYSLSKHEPVDVAKYGPNYAGKFGTALAGKAQNFIFGNYNPDGSFNANVKGWDRMSDGEKDAFMAQTNALKNNTPERLALRQARETETKNSRHEQQVRQQQEAQDREYAERAQQQAARWAALSPAERQQIAYNRQLEEYNEAVERNQYMDMMPQQQPQQFGQQLGGSEMSPVMLNDLMQGIQSEQTRYVPMRPRRSIHDRVMSSFDQNMFSPEFMPEEENGY